MADPAGEQPGGVGARDAVAVLRREPGLSAEQVCEAYERLRAAAPVGSDPPARRREGQCRQDGIFYTPPVVAMFMVAAARAQHESRRNGGIAPESLTLLDPACGAGSFLVAGARSGFGRLVGIDRDPFALEAAAMAIQRTGARLAASPCLTVIDALASPLPPADCIVANPPYVSSDTLAPELRDELRGRFPEWIKPGSKPDLYLYFLARIAVALEHGGGAACVIVPNRILSGDVAAPMRERLRPLVVEIVDVGHLRVFPAADVHPVILMLDGARRSTTRRTFRAAVPRSLEELCAAPRMRRPFRIAPRAPEIWLTSCDRRLASLFRHVHRFPPLRETWSVREGLRAGARGASRPAAEVHALPPGQRRHWVPEFRGRHIRPYHVTGHEGYFPRPASHSLRSGTRLHDQLGRKAVFPELCRTLGAAVQEGHVAYGGVYYVPERERARPLEVLVGYLCSPLSTVVYRGLYGAGAWHGSLKLRTRYVEGLPLPPSERHDARLCALVSHLAAAPDDGRAARCVDRLVYDLFELDANLVELVEARAARQGAAALPSLAEAEGIARELVS